MKNLRTGTAKFDTIRAKDANGLSIQDDGGNGLFIKDGGNVGIGTTNPAVKLEVVNSASTNIAQFSSTSSNLGGYILIQGSSEAGSAGDLFVGNGKPLVTSSSDASAAIRASTELLFSIGAVEKMRIDSAGNVGIGTTNPGSLLEVYSNSGVGNTQIHIHNDSTGNAAVLRLEGGRDTTNSNVSQDVGQVLFVNKGNITAGIRSYHQGDGQVSDNDFDDGDLRFLTSDHGSSSVLSTRMVINKSGNVGIGTTNPLTKMYVGTSAGDYSSSQGINEGLTIDDPNQSSLNLYHGGAGSALSRIVGIKTASGNTDLAFITQNTVLSSQAGRQEWMRITSVGNVGIGTTSPIYPLDVFGFGKFIAITSKHADGTRITHASLSNDSSGYGKMDLYNNVGNSVVRILSNGNSYFNGGNVGIGTANPSCKFHVRSGDEFNFNIDGSTVHASARFEATAGGRSIALMSSAATESNYIGSMDSNHSLRFFTTKLSDSSRNTHMTITEGGNVGIGTTNPGGELHIHGDNSSDPKLIIDSGSAGYASSISFTADSERAKITGGYDTGGGGYITFNTDSAGGTSVDRMRINNAGSVAIYSLAASADVVTNASRQLTTSSDKRLKNDLGDCEYGLNEILQVYPKKYTWKEGSEDQQPTVGFFAQDIHPIMPEAAPRELIENENGEDDYKWGLNSQTIIAALVNATKEQQQLIDDLKSQNESLAARISALES
jgi:hypothetical protein